MTAWHNGPMRCVWAVVLAGAVSLTACGGGSSPQAAASSSSVDEATTTTVATATTGAPVSATTGVTTGGVGATTTTRAAAATSPSTAPSTTGVAHGTGLIHGTVERDCSTNPASGGGCFNQSGAVAGAAVQLQSTGGQVLARTTTDASGVFEFRTAAGRYVIKEMASGVSQERDVVEGSTTFVGLVLPGS